MIAEDSCALSNFAVNSRSAASPRCLTSSTMGLTFAIISSDLSTGLRRSWRICSQIMLDVSCSLRERRKGHVRVVL